jgi:replication-associated recombination protein RarA
MSTTGELIRKMIQAHAQGNRDAFQAAAEAYIAEERRKNHHLLANDLERALLNGAYGTTPPAASRSFHLLGIHDNDLPRDKDRGAPLVEVLEPRRSIDDLVLTSAVRELLDRIILEQRRADVLRSYGLRPSGKMLFCGPPGCGKTVAAEAVAQALYLPLVLVRFDGVVSSYLGETAANLRKVFTFAKTRQMVMLFDEFDAIGKQRTATEEHGELKRVVNSFLQLLDGFRGESLLIAATNHQGLLDPALWRRFDEIIFFAKPDAAAIAALFRRHLHQTGINADILLGDHIEKLAGSSHADIERIALDIVKQTILNGETPSAGPPTHVTCAIVERALQRHYSRQKLTITGQSNTSTSDV